MFEVTFANWVIICRFLYENVDEKYALFFVGYKLVMGIAVLRIMYAVFMHVTFECAASDEETILARKKREESKYAAQIRKVLKQFDSSGDGQLSRDEFLEIIQDVRVRTLLSALGIDIHDAHLVFDLTDDGDGTIGANEMVKGFRRLKGWARSLDLLALTNLTKEVIHKLDLALGESHMHSAASHLMAQKTA